MDTVSQNQSIFDIERQFWRTAGAKEEAIRALGMTPVRYYQRLNAMIWTDAALKADPQLVYRLRRISRARHP